MQAAAYLRKCRSTRGRPLGRIRPDQLSCLFPPPPCVSPVLQLRLTVSGSAACPTPIMERWEQLSGAPCLPPYPWWQAVAFQMASVAPVSPRLSRLLHDFD